MPLKKRHRNRIILLCLAALLPVCASCGETPLGGTPAPMPTPTGASEPAKGTPAPTPSETPTASPTQERYDITELDGIASANDVLPAYASYEDARAAGTEVIGWLTLPNTSIDYPVCLNDTDETYYMDHNSEGKLSKYGAIFMDTRNADLAQQQHILIYGHDMRNGTMFHDLANYKQKTFFDQNRYITLLWNDTETVWQIFLATVIGDYDVEFASTRFESGNAFASFMESLRAYAEMVSHSIIDDRITIGPNDQVLTLSTCTYRPPDSKEQRFIVQARRIR